MAMLYADTEFGRPDRDPEPDERATMRTAAACSLLVVAACVGAAAGSTRVRADGDGGATVADFRRVVREAKDRVFPSVVFVKCVTESSEGGKKEGAEVSGSGVLISAKGEFLTNWHVVEDAKEVRCLLLDGSAYRAKILGTDKDTDVALGQLEAPADAPPFPFAALGDSDALVEGDFVMAMGAPWGMSRSVSIGIVACTRRYLEGTSQYSLWIQTDASISPGNSGGPLVNTKGDVVGLNTRGTSSGGDLGFAVPASTIRLIVDQVRKHGKPRWTWTGLHLQPLHDFERNTYFEGRNGVIVADTDPDSPARTAGVLPQDRILSLDGALLNGTTIEDLPAIERALGTLPLDKPAALRVQRAGKDVELTLVPREKGAVKGEELACKRWDLSFKTINQFEHPELYFHKKAGIFVFGVKRPGNASSAGLHRGDIVLKIGSVEINTLDEAKAAHAAALEKLDKEPRIVLTILRNGLLRQIVLEFQRDYERE
jgi:serine protease Do